MPPAPASPEHLLSLTFRAGAFADGDVPVTVLAQKLQALQTLLYHAAAAVQGDRSPRLGQWVSKHREVAEIAFKQTKPGSLVAESRLRNGEPSLFEIQQRVLLLASAALTAAANGQPLPLSVGADDRMHLLRSVEELCPSTLDDYQVDVGLNGAFAPFRVSLTGQTRRGIRERIAVAESPDATDEEQVVLGTLVQTNVDVGDRKIVLRLPRAGGGFALNCYYPTALRDQVANLIGGSLVEVHGRATVNADGELREISDVYSIEMVDTSPIQLRSLMHDGTRYVFAQRVAFDVEYVEGVWVYANELLNISGFAHSREDALRELADAMGFAWTEYAMAPDVELDGKAIELKRRLLQLVKPEPAAGGGGR